MSYFNRRELFYRVIFCFVGYCLGLFWQSKLPVNVYQRLQFATTSECSCEAKFNHTLDEQFDQLKSALKSLARGFKYIKSSKARLHLQKAFTILNGIVQTNHNSPFFKSKIRKAKDVCPEYFIDMYHGYPYYYTGYEIENCTDVPLFSSLVTVLLDTVQNTGPKEIEILLGELQAHYKNLPVIIPTTNISDELVEIKRKYPTVSYITFETEVPEGQIWKSLAASATTKYVFVAKRMTRITNDTRLERLVRVLSYTNSHVVGGSHRNETGHYSLGCYQTAMRNYAYRLIEGYDLSYNSCIYCDYLSGPFMTTPPILFDHMSESLSGEILFVNFFQSLSNDTSVPKVLVCPDAMYFVQNISPTKIPESDWLKFAIIWELNVIIMPSGDSYSFTCSEVSLQCTWSTGVAIPLCCVKEIADMTISLMKTCQKHDIMCEIEGGTVVGSLKFSSALPWERDLDINFHCRDYEKMLATEDTFDELGYSLSNLNDQTDIATECASPVVNNSVNCGYLEMRSSHYRAQIYGAKYLASQYLQNLNISYTTKTLVNGVWLNTYPNPALYARNLYGDDIFEHVEHWMDLGYSTGWIPYKTGNFTACPRPNFHACLDQFLPTGNLQFLDVWL